MSDPPILVRVRDVGQPLVIVLAIPPAEILEIVEKIAGEQANADADFEDKNVLFELARLVSLDKRGVEDFGRVAGERAVVVDDERNRGGIGEERLVATLAKVLLVTRTEKSAGHEGFSLFVVDTDLPGFSVSRELDKLGMRSSDTAELVLEDVAADYVLVKRELARSGLVFDSKRVETNLTSSLIF